jgi:hypothetical protein
MSRSRLLELAALGAVLLVASGCIIALVLIAGPGR